jgi:hypothetical protein
MNTLTREKALAKLLQPITWNWSSPIRARQELVYRKRDDVRTIYPFLTTEEKIQADKWFKEESHSDLWE